jgi:hypothetical protein
VQVLSPLADVVMFESMCRLSQIHKTHLYQLLSISRAMAYSYRFAKQSGGKS